MTDFNKRISTTDNTCGNCYMGLSHAALGLLCGYDEKPTKRDEVCALYIRQAEKSKEAKDEKQGALF